MKNIWNEDSLDQIKELVYIVDAKEYQLVQVNQRIKERFPEYRKGSKCYALFYGKDQPCKECGITKAIQGKPVTLHKQIESGEIFEVSFRQYAQDQNLCICTATDIPSITESIEMVRNVLNSLHAAAYAINPETYRVTFVNAYLHSLLPEMQRGALCYKALMGRDQPCRHCPFLHLSETGDSYHMEVYIQKLKKYLNIDAIKIDRGNNEHSVIFTGYDVTARVENEKRLHKIAFLDLAVNLKNQIAFMQDLGKRLDDGKSCSVYIVRLRNFSNYNLILGRKAGDEFLKQLVDSYCVRYGTRSKIYRIGGVKFALIADTPEENACIAELAKQPISRELSESNRIFQPDIEFVGIEVPRFARKAEQVIHNLEYILTREHSDQQGDIIFFREKDIAEMERKNKIVALIKQDIRKSGFEVYFQPIYSVQDKKFCKSEALLRLYDEELGWISPVEFIPIAEANGTISKLGRFVLEEVCSLLQARRKKGLPDVQINVNVSAVQFSTEDFYKTVADTLEVYDIVPDLLHLEITESVMMNSFQYIVSVMTKIIKLGVNFSIDDFGTGYSSLSYLGALPLRGIKLDRSFIKEVVHSDIHMMIVNNVIKFSKDLGFTIVAEGVEEVEQYEILRRLGCDYIQGFLFSKAIMKEEFETFLEKYYDFDFTQNGLFSLS